LAWDDVPDFALDVARTLLQTVKDNDEHTFYHCCRVGRGSRRLAKALGMNEFEQIVLEFSGLFHDIGKSKIPHEILVKPTRLEKAEIEIMKTHPMKSAEMISHLEHIPFFRFLMAGIRLHHEKVDGTGYPFGLKGDAIPLPARLIAVVDTYDAMTNHRPYRKPLSKEKAIQELLDFSSTQFDPEMVRIFLDLLPHQESEEKRAEKEELVIASLLKAG
jgi:HD-GYP domain-containing protein (c-di-GMP phosphodiesterase class II)